MLEALQRINRELGTTTAIITHNAGIAEMADRVIQLTDGKISDIRIVENPKQPDKIQW